MGRSAASANPPDRRRFVALLRGVNVGGNNLIKMTDLRDCLEGAGLTEVATYIQSGNVVFAGPAVDAGSLAKLIEAAIAARFGHSVWALVLTEDELREVVTGAPPGYGTNPAEYRHDVVFVRPPLTPALAFGSIPAKPGVDEVVAGRNAIYFSRVLALATKSSLPKIIQLPIYRDLTIRNWTTTRKLLALVDRR